jgi:hypothetical protein
LAIKGKRKSKARSGRTIAVAPRPFLVPPKTPLMRRTGTIVVLVLLAETLVFTLLAVAGARSEADAYRDQVREFGSLAEAQLYQGGAAQPSFGSPLVLPELGQALGTLQTGETTEKQLDQISESAQNWGDISRETADGIAELEADSRTLKEARDLMRDGLRLYSQIADQMRVAVQLEGEPRQQLLTSMGEQLLVAAEIFDAGFGKLQTERHGVGLETTSLPPSGFPGEFPGGIPGLPGESP